MKTWEVFVVTDEDMSSYYNYSTLLGDTQRRIYHEEYT